MPHIIAAAPYPKPWRVHTAERRGRLGGMIQILLIVLLIVLIVGAIGPGRSWYGRR